MSGFLQRLAYDWDHGPLVALWGTLSQVSLVVWVILALTFAFFLWLRKALHRIRDRQLRYMQASEAERAEMEKRMSLWQRTSTQPMTVGGVIGAILLLLIFHWLKARL